MPGQASVAMVPVIDGESMEDTELNIKAGSTSVILSVPMRTSTGAMKTGLAHTDVTVYYAREGVASPVAVVLSAGTPGTWSSGGWVELNAGNTPGVYQFGIPNAAIAASARDVVFHISATGAQTQVVRVPLVGYDPTDGVRIGLTSLPNAAASAEGGLPVLDSDGDVDAKVTNTPSLDAAYDAAKTAASSAEVTAVSDQITALDAIVDNIHDTDLPEILTQASGANTQAIAAVAAIAALNDIGAADVVAALKADVVDGSITFEEAMVRLLAFVSGDMTAIGTDPTKYEYLEQDGSTVAMTHSIPASNATRTVT